MDLEKLSRDNHKWLFWFNVIHKPQLEDIINHTIIIVGSRSSGLCYPESDLDCAVIVKEFNGKEMELLSLIKQAYTNTQFSKRIILSTTYEGFPLLTALDTVVGIKIQIVFRTLALHQDKLDKTRRFLEHLTPETKLEYILKNRDAFLTDDKEKLERQKEWMKMSLV